MIHLYYILIGVASNGVWLGIHHVTLYVYHKRRLH